MGHYGDSGSGALVEHEGELYIAGVKSNGEDGFFGSSHEYTRAGGIARAWIHANLDSLDARVAVESCDAYTGVDGSPIYDGGDAGGDESGGDQTGGDESSDDQTGGDEAGQDSGDDGTLYCDDCADDDDYCWWECVFAPDYALDFGDEYAVPLCDDCDEDDWDCWDICELAPDCYDCEDDDEQCWWDCVYYDDY